MSQIHPVLLQKKAKQLRKRTGDSRWTAPADKLQRSVVRAVGQSLLRPFQLLLFEPMCLNLCLFSAILLGILYLFFGAFPLVFGSNHGFNAWQVGLSFTGILAGMILGIMTDPLWHRIRRRLMDRLETETGVEGASEPEFRLPPAIVGSFLVPAGIFIFGWSSFAWVHWIVPIIGSCIFAVGQLVQKRRNASPFRSVHGTPVPGSGIRDPGPWSTKLCRGLMDFGTTKKDHWTWSTVHEHPVEGFHVDAYPSYAASALAANAFVRCLFAGFVSGPSTAAFPLFGVQMYEKLGYQWASSVLAFLTVAMLPFPYIFFRYGKQIREKSRYAAKS
ncbi:hypothetical protein E4U43_001503 [Claviceps pusilla]|uniref:Uncharacterized protein n=1 Tax=Claviceps pusilla TaxID=123648 RepID=A0A9P7N7Y8_9HYPO|nr:hypothetical protein E4U43_001503 [Claviceps pusilla]